MIHSYNGTNVYYEIIGNGKTNLVFLHGWGGNIDSFKFVCSNLNISCKSLIIDFPPFGNSDEPKDIWQIFDYVNLTREIIEKEHFDHACLIGHSFGGRVATILASKGIGSKLLLIDSAGMKVKRPIKYHIKVAIYKLCKKLKIKNNLGSTDYKILSPIMKKTFVNIVNTYLEKYAININIPTLIVWGEKDKDTPLYMAKKLNKLIKSSELIVLKNAGHFAYVEKAYEFCLILNAFLTIY